MPGPDRLLPVRVSVALALPLAAVMIVSSAGGAAAAGPTFTRTAPEPQVGAGPLSVAIGDLDDDGRPDLATTSVGERDHIVSVLLASTTTPGSYSTAAYLTGDDPYAIVIGDLNGDGRPDLATADLDSNTVSVFLARTTTPGTFEARTAYEVGQGPFSVAIGDLNGDGRPDLATANSNGGTVSVLLASTTTPGTFDAATAYPVGTFPIGVAIGDLNGDGRPDLATADAEDDTVSVLLASTTTPGSFTTATPYPTGNYPASVAIGDLDGDGRPDLATADLVSNTVSVLLAATTPGTFAAATAHAVGTSPRSVVIGDLDDDGRPDLATADLDSNTVSVLLAGAGAAGDFEPAVSHGVGAGPAAVATGDLDGNGRLDLATANFRGNSVSLLLQDGAELPPPVVPEVPLPLLLPLAAGGFLAVAAWRRRTGFLSS